MTKYRNAKTIDSGQFIYAKRVAISSEFIKWLLSISWNFIDKINLGHFVYVRVAQFQVTSHEILLSKLAEPNAYF